MPFFLSFLNDVWCLAGSGIVVKAKGVVVDSELLR